MVDFAEHDVLAGSALGIIDHFSTDGVHVSFIEITDDQDNPMRVNGIAVSPTGEIYTARGDPSGIADEDPHDVAYRNSDPPEIVGLLARMDDTLELWRMNTTLTATIARYANIDVDPGWTKTTYAKLRLNAAGTVAYYTTRQDTLFRWDLVNEEQMAPLFALDAEDPYILAAFDVRANGDLVTAETAGGNGPRNAVAIDGNVAWIDEINPDDDSYEARKIGLPALADVLTYTVDFAGTNAEITALAVWQRLAGGAGRTFAWVVS